MSRLILLDKSEQPTAEQLDLGRLGNFEVDGDGSGLLVARLSGLPGDLWVPDGVSMNFTKNRAGQTPVRIKVTSGDAS